MKNNIVISKSPGRINIIGEHTDYNDGYVLPAAIDKASTFKMTKNGSKTNVNVKSIDMGNSYSFELDNFKPIKGGWENYVMGVAHELQNIGASIEGFDAEFSGDIPVGAGMSSSAALECSLAFGLNEMFNLGLDHWKIIKVSQMAEHNFVGIKCGIMDQFASVMGKKDHVMLLDCRTLEFKYFPLDLGEYELLLLNTNVSHELASSEYNTRRTECEQGVSILKAKYADIQNLRDVSLNMLQENTSIIPSQIFNRCHHVITENNRVLSATDALVKKDFKELGKLIYQSHFSLQNDFAVSCPELDYLVQLTIDKEYVLGSRMMGGGFGGCTLNLIEKKSRDQFIKLASEGYRNTFKMQLSPYFVSTEDGARIINK